MAHRERHGEERGGLGHRTWRERRSRATRPRPLLEAREAIAFLESASDDLQLLHARRLAYLLADLAEGALLLDEAAWSIGRDGDIRKAVVARHFTRRRLSSRPVRGIVDDDRTVLDLFEPIIRYGRIDA